MLSGMCGRFVQRCSWHEVQDPYELPDGPARNLQARYNIAPTEPVEVARLDADGATEPVSMR
jgi:putative SOS response-associated peptidase YedK